MIPACHRTLLVLLPWCAAAALAQQPPAAPASAPGNEAMERARRDAANPLRVILDAGRIQLRRRNDAAPAVATPVVAPAPAAMPPRREATRSLAGAPPEPAAAPAPEPVLPASTVPPAPPAVAERTPEPLASAPIVVEPPAALAPAAEPPAVVRPAPAETLPAPAAVPEPEPAPPGAPTLVSMVEPAIPPTVLSRVGTLREVTADLTLRPDGSVAAVTLAPGTPRAAARYLTQAFEQWRFAPLAAERVHRVQLVFGD